MNGLDMAESSVQVAELSGGEQHLPQCPNIICIRNLMKYQGENSGLYFPQTVLLPVLPTNFGYG